MIPPLIDVHSHLIPGVDDGAATRERAAAIVAELWGGGVREICLTPHLALSRTSGDARAAALTRLTSAFDTLVAATADSQMRFWRGAEVMINEPVVPQHELSSPITLGGSRALLVEFPLSMTDAAIRGTVRALVARGLVPLIAHAERYACCTPFIVASWRREGAWVQVDATTALFETSSRGDRARALLSFGVADLLAADNHGDDRSLARAYEALVLAGYEAEAGQLCSTAPRALLSDGVRIQPPSIDLGRARGKP